MEVTPGPAGLWAAVRWLWAPRTIAMGPVLLVTLTALLGGAAPTGTSLRASVVGGA